jgi:glutamate/tyrosine decarboxylase-like PLP-dependent enzyme
MIHHPDRGGDNETMKQLNLAFEKFFNMLKNFHKTVDGKKYEKACAETPKEFVDLIDALVKLHGLVVEICGSFVWVSGNTKANKEALKALGLRYSGNKQAWYKAPAGYRKSSNRKFTMDEIRTCYGSNVVADNNDDRQTVIAGA